MRPSFFVSRCAASVAMVGICLAPTHVVARPQTALDPDDSPGPLDTVAARHRGEDATLTLKLVTYEAWGVEALSGIDSFITFEFDFDADAAPDACLDVDTRDGVTLVGEMYTVGCQLVPGNPAGPPVPVTRPDDHGIVASIPRRWVARRGAYAWRSVTSFDDDGHEACPSPVTPPPERRYGTCQDFTRWRTVRG